MERAMLHNLLPIMPNQKLAIPAQNSPEGEEGAFQLLLENLLFETLAGQVVKEGSGLLTGIQIGLEPEDASGEEGSKGQELLALLEMLQAPLMEHFRNSLPQEGGLIQGNLAGNQSGTNQAMISLTNLPGGVGGNGELPVQQDDQGFLTNIADVADSEGRFIPFKSNSQAVDSYQPNNSQQFTAGNPAANAKNNESSNTLKNTVSFPEQSYQPNSLSADQNFVVPNNAKEAGMEQQQLNLAAVQTPESQEVGTPSNQVEGSSASRHGITLPEMTEQMIQSGKLKMLATKQEMEIQLKPEYLGKLAIRLTLENGAMTARFIVESHQVGRMLEQNLPQLKQTLAEQGIRFDQAQVEVGDPGSFAQERHPQWQQGRTPREPFALNPLEHNHGDEDTLEINQTTGIDYRA